MYYNISILDVYVKRKQNITIHGSTGTIGKNTLSVIAKSGNKFKVYALTARRNINVLYSQINNFRPKYAVVFDQASAKTLSMKCKKNRLSTSILSGEDNLIRMSSEKSVDYVLSGISGAAALKPTYAAILAGKKVLLANKESLIMSGNLMLKAAEKSGSVIIPVDSEHNALFQILFSSISKETNINKIDKSVNSITLTASGGPFLNYTQSRLRKVTPLQATKHPTWKMGQKISVDSATMMNKGLEVIEASILYGINLEKINILIHPQSIVHALVTFEDGSTISHMSDHDMKVPISYALSWPDRFSYSSNKKIASLISELNFRPVNKGEYPCLDLCITALKIGKNAPTILNAANEIAVDHFLEGSIKLTDIAAIIKHILKISKYATLKNIDDVIKCDKLTRKITTEFIEAKWK